MKKLNITKGEVFIQYNGHYHEVRGINRLSPYISVFSAKREDHPNLLEENICEQDEAKANAELIADAFNTYNECQILPSELLKQRNELLEALVKINEMCADCSNAENVKLNVGQVAKISITAIKNATNENH
jgi:hypothetical protein